MNIGIIGNGGREHALCKKIFKIIKKHFVFRNAGTSKLATNVKVDINFKKLLILINFTKLIL